MSDTRIPARASEGNSVHGGQGRELRAVGYCRVSTEQQLDGLSLGWQRETIGRAVADRGWLLASVVEEQASAKSLRGRPRLVGTLEALDAGVFDVLVVAKLDRLSRSTFDFYGLLDRARRRRWAVVCLSPDLDMTTSAGRAVAGMSMVFAEFERDIIGDRQRESVAARRAAGTYRPPAVQIESVVEERIRGLMDAGWGARRIARQLDAEGLRPPRAASWAASTVQWSMNRLRRSGSVSTG